MKRPEILDTTLREGEQCYGVFFPKEVKKRIAMLLDGVGVDFIEVGHPAAAPSIRQAAAAIADLGLRARLVGHARLDKNEILLVSDLGLPWVGLFAGINGLSLSRYGLSKQQVYQRVQDCVLYAQQLGLRIRFTCEDASRTDIREVMAFFRHLHSLGVNRVSYADTLGVSTPRDIEHFCCIAERALPCAMLHFHFHNDHHAAYDNAAKAIECGAQCIDASILGLGERTGIVRLEDILSLLNRNPAPWHPPAPAGGGKRFLATGTNEQSRVSSSGRSRCSWEPPAPAGGGSTRAAEGYRTATVAEAVRLVSGCINHEHYLERRFAHKSGIHINGILKNPRHYESMDPAASGSRRIVVLSKLIGRSGLQAILSEHGFDSSCNTVDQLLEQIKAADLLELAETPDIIRYFRDKGLGNPAPWHPPAPAGGGKRFLAAGTKEQSRVSSSGRSRCSWEPPAPAGGGSTERDGSLGRIRKRAFRM